ncbi:class I SAM-dependent methyltransferase [Halodesulfurarchaeum sp.]|uniref:class I SAM-dependent methyltransferase n=1 Tax=Halodesulfurarchaeum sp. TaxID=1980530 RepID=UPI002FC27C54
MDSQEVRQKWADRDGEYSPSYYANYGADGASEAVLTAIETYLGPNPAVLEVGCSSGRHLSTLLEAGYTDLTGVELNQEARDAMAENFPELARTATVQYESIESVVGEFADDQFEVVFSVETLQHLHPDSSWVFAELARITGSLLITIENEGGKGKAEAPTDVNYVDTDVPLYYRDWNEIFTALGLTELEAETGPRDTIRTFAVSDLD